LLREAEAAAERGERLARAPDPSVSHAHALLVLADVRARHGRTSEAEEALRAATGEIKTFADPGQLPLLAARVKRSLRAARAVVAVRAEPLSPAELVVLGLLATDLSQRGIGRKLFLSVNTIKTHTRSIYRKLAVTSRENAVTRGHALGLIGSDDSPG
jgi:LuxR family maltose regulon positive regulatory protein